MFNGGAKQKKTKEVPYSICIYRRLSEIVWKTRKTFRILSFIRGCPEMTSLLGGRGVSQKVTKSDWGEGGGVSLI